MIVLIDWFADGFNIARRNMTKASRVPGILVSALVSPLIIVVMFS